MVHDVWIMGHPVLDHWVDVTENVDRKLAALRAHESQTAHVDTLETLIRGWLTENAAAGDLPAGRLAEAYKRVTIP